MVEEDGPAFIVEILVGQDHHAACRCGDRCPGGDGKVVALMDRDLLAGLAIGTRANIFPRRPERRRSGAFDRTDEALRHAGAGMKARKGLLFLHPAFGGMLFLGLGARIDLVAIEALDQPEIVMSRRNRHGDRSDHAVDRRELQL